MQLHEGALEYSYYLTLREGPDGDKFALME